jgi:hypothetical protein
VYYYRMDLTLAAVEMVMMFNVWYRPSVVPPGHSFITDFT